MSAKKTKAVYAFAAGLGAVILLATFIAWAAAEFSGLEDWLTYFAFCLLSGGILAGGWYLLARTERVPGWLIGLTVIAALLRLGMGIVWFTLLPRYGYGSPSEMNGYVMSDAFKRDKTAWELGTSEKRLLAAYGGKYRNADQYGGLLFLSAGLYRLLGADTHPSLGMVALTAAFSALAVPVVWAFARRGFGRRATARRVWGEDADDSGDSTEKSPLETSSAASRIALLAAWALALYPEAVLQGSTQMREGFLITLVISAFYGLAYYHQRHKISGLVWIMVAVVLAAFLSPPTAGLLLVALVLTVFVWGGILNNRILRQPWFWIVAGVLLILVVAGSFFTLERLTGQSFSNPFEMLGWWFQKTAAYQAHLSERASGWIQEIFRSTPEWLHTPLLISYGIAQPFLPAAVIDVTGTMIWRLIAIWRSVGWFLLLPLLIYSTLTSFSRKHRDRLAIALSLVSWIVIILAAFRAGADPWDNVRYRAAFAGLQIALAAWGWVSYRCSPDPWFKRAFILVISVLAWFVPWYLRRYIYLQWPISSPISTLGLGVFTAALLILFDWMLTRRKKNPKA